MPSRYIQRIFNLEPKDHRIITSTANENGFGPKGHSAALRFILRDWKAMKKHYNMVPHSPEVRGSQPDPESIEE